MSLHQPIGLDVQLLSKVQSMVSVYDRKQIRNLTVMRTDQKIVNKNVFYNIEVLDDAKKFSDIIDKFGTNIIIGENDDGRLRITIKASVIGMKYTRLRGYPNRGACPSQPLSVWAVCGAPLQLVSDSP